MFIIFIPSVFTVISSKTLDQKGPMFVEPPSGVGAQGPKGDRVVPLQPSLGEKSPK